MTNTVLNILDCVTHVDRRITALALMITVLTLNMYSLNAQTIDDVAADAGPQWDALDRFRDNRICLVTATTSDVVMIPGFTNHLASRLLKLVRDGVRDSRTLADTLCLSVEQHLLLDLCTTTECSHGVGLHASVRSRMLPISQRLPAYSTRVDVSSDIARIGGVRTLGLDTATSYWASARYHGHSIVVGAYGISHGLGLVTGGSARFGGSLVGRARATDITPSTRSWTSAWTDNAFRGGALTLSIDTAQTSVWWSHQLRADRHEHVLGVSAFAPTTMADIALACLQYNYDRPSESVAQRVIRDTTATYISLAGQRSLGRVDLRSEFALTQTGYAWLTIAEAPFTPFTVILSTRSISPDYRAPMSSSITDASVVSNEDGILFGALGRIGRWRTSVSLDLHRRPSRSYGRPLSARGFDLLVDAVRTAGPIDIALRFRWESDEDGWRPRPSDHTRMTVRDRWTVRAEVTTTVHTLTLRTRLDVRRLSTTDERPVQAGALFYVDMRWKPIQNISFRSRFTSWKTDVFDVAPYAAEQEAEGMMRTLVATGTGMSWTVGGRWTVFSNLTVWMSASSTYSRLTNSTTLRGLVQIDVRS